MDDNYTCSRSDNKANRCTKKLDNSWLTIWALDMRDITDISG